MKNLKTKTNKFKKDLSEIIKEKHIDAWMRKKNKAFDNRTPNQVIKDGDIQLLYEMIYNLRENSET